MIRKVGKVIYKCNKCGKELIRTICCPEWYERSKNGIDVREFLNSSIYGIHVCHYKDDKFKEVYGFYMLDGFIPSDEVDIDNSIILEDENLLTDNVIPHIKFKEREVSIPNVNDNKEDNLND